MEQHAGSNIYLRHENARSGMARKVVIRIIEGNQVQKETKYRGSKGTDSLTWINYEEGPLARATAHNAAPRKVAGKTFHDANETGFTI